MVFRLKRIKQNFAGEASAFDQSMGCGSFVKRHNLIDNWRPNRSVRSSGHRPFHIVEITTGASNNSLPSKVDIFQIDRDFSAGMSTRRDKASL